MTAEAEWRAAFALHSGNAEINPLAGDQLRQPIAGDPLNIRAPMEPLQSMVTVLVLDAPEIVPPVTVQLKLLSVLRTENVELVPWQATAGPSITGWGLASTPISSGDDSGPSGQSPLRP